MVFDISFVQKSKKMKKLILGLFVAALSFTSCQDGGLVPPLDLDGENPTDVATIQGRWVSPGFEDNIRYDFTSDTRYTIYGDGSGEFPTLEEFLTENPGISGNPYVQIGDTVYLDLHFGNIQKMVPTFKCENKVMEFYSESSSGSGSVSFLFREGHDINACN